jgi:MYXO-CTERM domain-containing protein
MKLARLLLPILVLGLLSSPSLAADDDLARVTLAPRIAVPWVAGTTIRMQQSIDGIPVLGDEIIIAEGPLGDVRRTQGRRVHPVGVSSQPVLEASEALSRARDFLTALQGGEGELWPARAALRFTRTAKDGLRLVWLVDLSFAEPLGIYQVLVDAADGRLLGRRSTLFEVVGNAYPTNPIVSDLTEVTLLGLPEGAETLSGAYAMARSCDVFEDSFGGGSCTAKSWHAIADAEGDFLFSPDPTSLDDPLAEVQMYYHLDLIARWFDETQDFAHPYPTEGLVNFDYNNAFYGDIDGDGLGEVSFGQTASMDFAYDADVIYHEFGHSVFGRIAGQTGFIDADEYGMQWSTGGLNEGMSDLFALVLSGDPRLGEYAGSGGLGQSAIRDLEEDRHCPTDLYGEVHKDGEIFGAFGWNLIEEPLIGAQLTGDYIYGAVSAFPSDASWGDAGVALVATAQDMLDAGHLSEEQHAFISAELESSGLANCGRVIRLDEGQEPTQLMTSVSLFTDQKLPLGQQFSLDAPAGTYKLRFRVKDFLSNDPNLAWTLYVRRGEHIVHELEDLQTPFGTVQIPVPTDYDFEVDGSGADFELKIEADTDLALEPGATYYFSMASRQEGALSQFFANAEITIDGDAYIDDSLIGDEDDEDDAGGAGCACDSGSASTPAHLAWLSFLILTGVRRRRTEVRQREI